ncbi:MAG TPA: VanZ family protein [Candidatus Eisenbacteria bacterium]|nr:VanZ family protein [Candidatus Eisenbacteria bacterium]
MNGAPGGAGADGRTLASAFVKYWLPAIAYVGLIFSLSSIHGQDIPGNIPYLDKVAHLLEYSLLGLLLGRAIRFTMTGKGKAAAAGATMLLGAAVGAADEFYQRGVPGRSSDVRDWLTDVTAIALSVLFTQWVSTRALRRGAARAEQEGNR